MEKFSRPPIIPEILDASFFIEKYTGHDIKILVEDKLDGWRVMLNPCTETALLKSANKNVYAALCKIEPNILKLPKDIVDKWYVGEICADSGFATDVATVLQTGEKGKLYLYDIFYKKNPEDSNYEHDTPDKIRRELDLLPFLKPKLWFGGAFKNFESLKNLLTHVPEGLIIKVVKSRGEYYKLKKIKTIEVKITGYIPGKGMLATKGLIGSFVCEDKNGVELRVSGLSRKEREMRADQFIGKTIEIKFNGLTRKNMYRMPRFIRFREDVNV